MRNGTLAVCAAMALMAGCGKKGLDAPGFEALTREFTETTLALSPVTATAAGYHAGGVDGKLDDVSAAGVERQRAHFTAWKRRLAELDEKRLDAESRADLELMAAQCDGALLELDTLQGWRHNPTTYVELVGTALFTPYTVNYAGERERWGHIVARLGGVAAVAEAAKKNLVDSNAVWTRVAVEENEGTIELIEKEMAARVPAEMKGEYEKAAAGAVAALRGLSEHLKTLKDTGADGWRLGKEKYAKKFAAVMGGGVKPEELLKEAEEALTETRREMFMTASPLHVKYYPTHRDPVDLTLIVGEVLKKVAEKHVKAGEYFGEAEKTLEETRAFLRAHEERIVKMPGRDNLKLIETPAFMRGIYGVGGFNPAPALQPELGAFYWLTPIPGDWPAERVESKLREYNRYGLRILTIHEAIPGHYVQFEYANAVKPAPRRLLRALFGNGPYVEGWAVYATEVMLNEGYLEKDPEMELTWKKQLLRAIANTILDIRMHTTGMTDEEAMRLMVDKTFQEREEATAKLQRAKLSSCQLPTYFAGYRSWLKLRAAAEKKGGAGFRAGEFHERALRAGALPVATLARLMGLDGN